MDSVGELCGVERWVYRPMMVACTDFMQGSALGFSDMESRD
jgi:hypothetical protein